MYLILLSVVDIRSFLCLFTKFYVTCSHGFYFSEPEKRLEIGEFSVVVDSDLEGKAIGTSGL